MGSVTLKRAARRASRAALCVAILREGRRDHRCRRRRRPRAGRRGPGLDVVREAVVLVRPSRRVATRLKRDPLREGLGRRRVEGRGPVCGPSAASPPPASVPSPPSLTPTSAPASGVASLDPPSSPQPKRPRAAQRRTTFQQRTITTPCSRGGKRGGVRRRPQAAIASHHLGTERPSIAPRPRGGTFFGEPVVTAEHAQALRRRVGPVGARSEQLLKRRVAAQHRVRERHAPG